MCDTPTSSADMIFMSSTIADLVMPYINGFGGFMNIPRSLTENQPSDAPAKGVLVVASELQHALAEELSDFRIEHPQNL